MSNLSNNGKHKQAIRIWKIDQKEPKELHKTMIPLEENLEDWLENDISMISKDILVIGRQVNSIDLLCIDNVGNLVILELKRDKTPRDVTSQAIEYASWVNDLSAEDIFNIGNKYLASKSIDDEFEDYFMNHLNVEFPDRINTEHRILIVGSNIDSSTQRIVSYLNERGIDINVFTFDYFEDTNIPNTAFIASTYLIEPSIAEARSRKSTSRRKGEKLDKKKFLETVDEFGKPFFEKLISMVEENNYIDDYGSESYSIYTEINGKKTAFARGYRPNKEKQAMNIFFSSLLSKLNDFNETYLDLKNKFKSTGKFVDSGPINLRWVIDSTISKQESNLIVDLIKEMAEKI